MHYAHPSVSTTSSSYIGTLADKTLLDKLYQLANRTGPHRIPPPTYNYHSRSTPTSSRATPSTHRRRNAQISPQPAPSPTTSQRLPNYPQESSYPSASEADYPTYHRIEPRTKALSRTRNRVDHRTQQRLNAIKRSIRNEHKASRAIRHIELILSERRFWAEATKTEELLNTILFNPWKTI